MTLQRHQTLYTLPVGETRPYFSFEGLARRVSEAHVSDSAVVRHTSVANKWKTIHLLLHSGHNATQIQYNLTLQGEGDAEFAMSFSVAVDTREIPQTNTSQPLSKDGGGEAKSTPTPEPAFPFSEVPEDRQGPKIKKKQPDQLQLAVDVPLVNISLLPAAVQNELHQLEEKLLIGDITVKGYNMSKAELLKPYVTSAGRKPTVHSKQARESDPKEQRRPFKDSKGEVVQAKPHKKGEAEEIIFKGNSNDEKSKLDGTKALLPDRIDEDKKEVVTLKQPSKLLSSISKPRLVQKAGGVPVGRKLQHFITSDRGFLPWERRKYFQEVLEVRRGAREFYLFISLERFVRSDIWTLFQNEERLLRALSYNADGAATGRRLQDTFADSLRHVNKLLNSQFGFTSRKVPAHMPHMIDRLVMQGLQDM